MSYPIFFGLLLAFVSIGSASAADRRWTGEAFDNTWSEPDNWAPAGPPQDGDTLIFGNLGSHLNNRNDLLNLRVQSIVFDGTSGGYNLTGNPIRLNSDITAAHTKGFNNVRLDVQFIGGGGSFSVVRGGRIEISGTTSLSNGGTLIAFTLGTNLTISGPIVGDGGLTKIGSEALFLTGNAANAYTGPTFINGGTLYLAKPSGARAISSRVSIGENSLTLCSLADLEGGQYPPAMSVYVGPYADWALTNGATVSNLTIEDGFIRGEGLLSLQCNVTNIGYSEIHCSLYLGDQTRTFFVDYENGGFAAQLEISGHILGPSGGGNPPGITKEGPGILMLQKQNTYSGLTLINDGGIEAEHPEALGTATSGTRVGPEGYLGLGPIFSSSTMTFAEPVIMEGGDLFAPSDVILNGTLTLNADSSISGPSGQDNARLDIRAAIGGPAGAKVVGGNVRFSGATPNTFAGALVVEPGYFFPDAVLELAKPNDMATIPTSVTLRGFQTNVAILRQFQNNGARMISIEDGGVWDLNGFAAAPTALKFYGAGVVDTGRFKPFPGVLDFTGSGVNTQLQVFPKLKAPTNYVAAIYGSVFSFSQTNDLLIPPGVTLDISADVAALTLQKRGSGKLVLGGNNRSLLNLHVREGELVSKADRATGVRATVRDGATLRLASVFNFGSFTIEGRGFQGNGALATEGLALFSSNVVLAAPATINSAGLGANLQIQGTISGTGPLTKDGTGILAFAGNSPNTFSGEMLVNSGTLELGKNDFVPAVPGDIVIGSGVAGMAGANVIYSGHDQIWNRITINRDSVLDLNGRDEYSGDVTLNDGGSIFTRTGTLYLGQGVNLFVNPRSSAPGSVIGGRVGLGPGLHHFRVGQRPGGGALDLDVTAGVVDLSGPADIVKEGPGAMGFRQENSFSGTLIINEGNVSAAHPMAFGTGAGGTIVNNNATLTLSGDTSGNFWVREESLTLNSTNPLAFLSFGKSNTWSGNILLQRNSGINVSSFSVLNLMSFFDCCPGIISGSGGIIKGGPGTLYISGFAANSYAGSTVVNDGVLEAWRILSPALPGNVVVTGRNSYLRTGRHPAITALSPNSRVTISEHAVWQFNAMNTETVRALSGNGIVDLGGLFHNASLTVNNTNFCEFSGVLTGTGALSKQGPAMLLLSGQSVTYGGTATVVEGTLRVDGRIAHVTVKGGAQLRGDGVVADITAIEQDSVVQVDASFADHPDRQGGDLEGAYLTLGPGAIAGADIFGPSPTGGNDLLIAHGPVKLGNARLSAEFKYPPRDGDVITLIRKNSFGPFTDAFSGWPEGATRKLGDVTVRASYLGGDGNDFTLTVTNLPLAFASVRLAEGNGNQTVEPDECNLLFVALANRRGSSLTLTNVLLRALTPGAAVTVASTRYSAIPTGAVRENLTPFQFRTDANFPCGSDVAFELIAGVAGEGVFAIPFTIVGGTECGRGTGGCESCFVVSGQFTTNSPALLRAHNFIGSPSLCFPPKRCPETNVFTDNLAVPYLAHSFTNLTTNELCLTAHLRFGGPGIPATALGAVAYLGTNDYHDPCANYLGDTGADGAQPFSFRVPPQTNFVILVSARATNVIYDHYTLALFGLPCPAPGLQIARDRNPEKVLLQWSTAVPEYRLQSADGLSVTGPFQFGNVSEPPHINGGRYTVTNDVTGPQRIYRLER